MIVTHDDYAWENDDTGIVVIEIVPLSGDYYDVVLLTWWIIETKAGNSLEMS